MFKVFLKISLFNVNSINISNIYTSNCKLQSSEQTITKTNQNQTHSHWHRILVEHCNYAAAKYCVTTTASSKKARERGTGALATLSCTCLRPGRPPYPDNHPQSLHNNNNLIIVIVVIMIFAGETSTFTLRIVDASLDFQRSG